MSILLGFGAGALGFMAAVLFVNIICSVIGLYGFDPNFKPGLEQKYPLVAVLLSGGALVGLGWLSWLVNLTAWYFGGVIILPGLMVGALLYFNVFMRD